MYDISEVYRSIDQNHSQISIIFSFLVVSAYFQVGYAVYLGFRDRSHAIPLVALMMFFAHDSEHFFNYRYWTETIQNPFFQGGYWTFPVYLAAELTMFYQIIRYSRDEVFPGATLGQSIIALIVLQLFTLIGYLWLHEQFGDPLYLTVALGVSQTASHAFNIPMLLRRGSRKGQSLVFAVNLIIGAGILSWFFALPLFAATYRTPLHYAMGAVTVALGLIYLFLLWRAPKYMRPGKEEAALAS